MRRAATHTYSSVWDAIADTPTEAANLRVRSELMRNVAVELAAIIAEDGCTQAEVARRCGVTQPRINDLLWGRISRFSIDALVNIAASLGFTVQVTLDRTSSSSSRRGKDGARATKQRRGNRPLAG